MESDRTQAPFTWVQSLLWLSVGLPAMLLSAIALTVATPPGLFLSLQWRGLALGLLVYSVQAMAEETAKAIGVSVANLRRTRLNWIWITAFIGGTMGTLERILWFMNATPEARDWLPGALGLLFVVHATIGHAALSLVCVMTARVTGGGWVGWLVGVVGASVLHMLHNLLPLRIDFGGAYVWPSVTGVISLAIISVAFALRNKLDWRSATIAAAPSATMHGETIPRQPKAEPGT